MSLITANDRKNGQLQMSPQNTTPFTNHLVVMTDGLQGCSQLWGPPLEEMQSSTVCSDNVWWLVRLSDGVEGGDD